MKNLHALLLSAGCGMLAVSSFSPFNLWLIGIVTIAGIYCLLNNCNRQQALWRGIAYGIGLFGAGASWVYVSIHEYGATPIPLAIVLTALFVVTLSCLLIAPHFLLFSKLVQLNQHTQWRPFLFAAVWVVFEWIRSWLFTGFPWLIMGYSLIDTPFNGLAPVSGVFGLSFLYVLAGATLGCLLLKDRKALLYSSVVVCLLAVAGWLLQSMAWTRQSDQTPLSFSAIQGNISQNLRWQSDQLRDIVHTYQRMSAAEWQQDLIIWPENALPVLQDRVPDLMQYLDNQAEKTNTTLMLGMPWVKDNHYYNSFVSLGAGDHSVYLKQKLVPFGEFIPFAGLLRGVINFFNLPMSDFTAGHTGQDPFNINGVKISALICYEIVYPDFVAQEANNSHFLITVSNDTWFGRSIGPFQHFQMARMRALETGRFMIRATNDGISALINAKGEVVHSIEQYNAGILRGVVPRMQGTTPFMFWGSWPLILICFVVIVAYSRKTIQTYFYQIRR